jgi:hypothetical protein
MRRARPVASAREALTLLALALSLALCTACSRESAPAPEGTPIDQEVMAFLSEARARHHEASIREDSGDLAGATKAIDQLVHAARPHAGERVAEVEEVLADAYARRAELELKAGDVGRAEGSVKEGLAHAPEPTYFRGHLLEVEGIVEEARGAALVDAGKADEAQRARAHAIDLLHEAVTVQDQVITRALGDGGRK